MQLWQYNTIYVTYRNTDIQAYLPAYIFVYRSIDLLIIYPINQSNNQTINQSINQPPCLPACLPACLFVCPSIRLSVYLSIRLPVYPSIRPSVHPSIRPSIHPSIRPSIHPSMSVCLHMWHHICVYTVYIIYIYIYTVYKYYKIMYSYLLIHQSTVLWCLSWFSHGGSDKKRTLLTSNQWHVTVQGPRDFFGGPVPSPSMVRGMTGLVIHSHWFPFDYTAWLGRLQFGRNFLLWEQPNRKIWE